VINRVVWSADGQAFATCGADGHLVISSGETCKPRRVIRLEGEVVAAAFSPDATRIACSFADPVQPTQQALGLEVEPEPLPQEVDEVLGDYSVSTEWNPEPERGEGVSLPLRIFDCSTGDLLASFVVPPLWAPPFGMAWTSDGRILATCSPYSDLTIWQTRTGAVLHHDPELAGDDLALSPDGSLICVVGNAIWALVEVQSGSVV
jgi:WD40 repeat protein